MNFTWDGQFKGNPAAMGVYVYELHLVYLDDHTEKLFTGSLTLLRQYPPVLNLNHRLSTGIWFKQFVYYRRSIYARLKYFFIYLPQYFCTVKEVRKAARTRFTNHRKANNSENRLINIHWRLKLSSIEMPSTLQLKPCVAHTVAEDFSLTDPGTVNKKDTKMIVRRYKNIYSG